MTTTAVKQGRIRYGEFEAEVGQRGPGMNLPQRMGRRLWLPMFLMAIMAFPAALILAAVRGSLVADGSNAVTAAALGQIIPAVAFIGFTSVFSAIVFAIARILGAFREGGGAVQEASGKRVLTLAMPATAKAMILLMMMAMMMLVFAIVAHFVLAGVVGNAVLDGDTGTVRTVASWATWLEGVRRLGAAVYLLSIAFGLATIVTVIRFQSQRIRELAGEASIVSKPA